MAGIDTLTIPYAHCFPNFRKGIDTGGAYYEVEYLFDEWADSDLVCNEMIGEVSYVGGTVLRGLPHAHPLSPNLYCQEAHVIEGYDGPTLNAMGYPGYNGGFKVKATYRAHTLGGPIQPSDDPQNLTQIDPTTPILWCSQEIDHETEVLTLPNHQYLRNDNGNAAPVPLKFNIGVTVMRLTFYRLPYLPMGVARSLRGRVNSKKFLGAAIGCVYFRGAQTFREVSSDGSLNQRVTLTFVERDQPWNNYLMPDGTWVGLVTAGGVTPYIVADLTPLIQL